jgi:hypothetical protein
MTNGGLAAIAILLAMTATPAVAQRLDEYTCQYGVVVTVCDNWQQADQRKQIQDEMRSLEYEMHGLEYEQWRQRDLDSMQSPPRSGQDDMLRYDQYRRR